MHSKKECTKHGIKKKKERTRVYSVESGLEGLTPGYEDGGLDEEVMRLCECT